MKLAGITLKLRTYLILQFTVISASLILAVTFSFWIEGRVLGYEAATIGRIAFLLVILELGELTYAVTKKKFTR